MKNIFIFVLVLIIAIASYVLFVRNQDESQQEVTEDEQITEKSDDSATDADAVSVTPISHATMVLEWGGTTIYVDPVGGPEAFAGESAPDLILLTDIHGDHLDPETLEAVLTENTAIIAPQAVVDELPDTFTAGVMVLANGSTTNQSNLAIEATPMYNLPESDDSYHVKGRGNGYLLEREGTRVYIAGDTEGTPEMRALTNIDIAFVPMNLPYTMSVEDAADAVLDFAPSVVYPYHYRGEDGLSDVEEFRRLVNAGNSDIEVRLIDWYPEADTADAASESENGEFADKGPDVVIDLVGTNYQFSQEEIAVEEGDIVQIRLTSGEGFHDWVVDEFDAATDRVNEGESTTVTFVADTAGTYEYYCSVGNHRAQGMFGELVVE